MQSAQNAQVAFYLTGQQDAAAREVFAGLALRPALFASRRDLTQLRYDYPLMLLPGHTDAEAVAPLSTLVDAALARHADRPDADRLRHHAHALERELRRLLAERGSGRFGTLRVAAMDRLGAGSTQELADSLRALSGLPSDAELLDCGRGTAGRLAEHLWAAAQAPRLAQMRGEIDRLTQKVADVLDAAQARSAAGHSPDALRAAIGTVQADVFDFVAFSRVLGRAAPAPGLPETRWKRLHWLLGVLESQRFFAATDAAADATSYSFRFNSCFDALRAWRERLPKAIELAKAMAIAELEITGEYDEARHDPVFDAFGTNGLDPALSARFPSYLVQLDTAQMLPAEAVLALEALDAGLPLKLLLQSDDILAPAALGDGACSLALAHRQLTGVALAAGNVYVLQASAAQLPQCRERLFAALAADGPALISVYSGAGGQTEGVPPFLAAAAATECRAFPSFAYDPAGPDQAARFSIAGNPQAERDWPLHELTYQDAAYQRVTETVAFTLVDLLACDRRYGREFAHVAPEAWNDTMAPAADCIAKPEGTAVPYLLMCDEADRVHKVVADARLVRAARRCLALWHGLRELGGIGNSYAARAVAEARAAWEAERQPAADAAPAVAPAATLEAAAPTAAPAAAETAAEPERSPDEAYIETARCSSCNECIQLNSKMFAYNADKQAYIADVTAGTYRQLVEAAESCQVAVIHPGKPRDPNEPGLDELLARAAAFA